MTKSSLESAGLFSLHRITAHPHMTAGQELCAGTGRQELSRSCAGALLTGLLSAFLDTFGRHLWLLQVC